MLTLSSLFYLHWLSASTMHALIPTVQTERISLDRIIISAAPATRTRVNGSKSEIITDSVATRTESQGQDIAVDLWDKRWSSCISFLHVPNSLRVQMAHTFTYTVKENPKRNPQISRGLCTWVTYCPNHILFPLHDYFLSAPPSPGPISPLWHLTVAARVRLWLSSS